MNLLYHGWLLPFFSQPVMALRSKKTRTAFFSGMDDPEE
jgi:hypothetical protein